MVAGSLKFSRCRPPRSCGSQGFFIELETGSATIWDQEKVTSTLAKLNRYSQFASGYAGKTAAGAGNRRDRTHLANLRRASSEDPFCFRDQ